jgi:hypothetical protein
MADGEGSARPRPRRDFLRRAGLRRYGPNFAIDGNQDQTSRHQRFKAASPRPWSHAS